MRGDSDDVLDLLAHALRFGRRQIDLIDHQHDFQVVVGGQIAIAGGIDEANYRKLTPEQMGRLWHAAAQAAGRKYILTAGCSLPNDSTPEELSRLPRLLGV
jgi:hypothetical protein